jgi:primosomal protein N' (replication factor Y)
VFRAARTAARCETWRAGAPSNRCVAAEETKSGPDGIGLNNAQRQAIDAALPRPPALQSLLQGVTGSGKTEVYLAAAARVIGEDRQALLLVPELSDPPTEQRIGPPFRASAS